MEATVRARDVAETYPVVDIDTSALVAARLIAKDRLPGLVVTDRDGNPQAVLPASEVVRFLVPEYVQDDPTLAGVLGEVSAERLSERLRRVSVAELLPNKRVELALLQGDDSLVELAATMARLRSPLCAVMDGHAIVGVVTAARLLELVCGMQPE
jgi:CBS domain-containing protein